jgi:hypothetical protein
VTTSLVKTTVPLGVLTPSETGVGSRAAEESEPM